MATTETIEPQRKPATGKKGPTARRVRVQIRRVGPLSVLKFSLIFYFCLMLVALVGFAILFSILDSIGVLEPVETLLGELGFGTTVGAGEQARAEFRIDFGYLMRTLFLIGLISTAFWAVFTVFLTFLYNLIADLVGGIELTLLERR
ncbi:MAG: DUF3566 domain-containing protein [Actinomycetota bacterium]|nr:DUF3566 domain-containing protein [Actinomycetota bacterium]